MPYIAPQSVVSPRSRIKSVEVLYDRGPVPHSWSVALLTYWTGEEKVGVRWNGDEESSLGNPQSRANPTWFVIPRKLAMLVREKAEQLSNPGLIEGYRAMSQEREREDEAQKWCEGLIGDATSQER